MRNGLLLALALSLGTVGVLAGASSAPAADTDRAKWAEHMGDIPFVIGFDKGMKDVEFTGKPPIVFFTADY